jgi:hypothetical protein
VTELEPVTYDSMGVPRFSWQVGERLDDETRRRLLDIECTNCDGRKCMDCVLRYMHDNCVYDCPFCCA